LNLSLFIGYMWSGCESHEERFCPISRQMHKK
jgi:hypothetical protein